MRGIRRVTPGRRRSAVVTACLSSLGNLAVIWPFARLGTLAELGEVALSLAAYTLAAGATEQAVADHAVTTAAYRRPINRTNLREAAGIGAAAGAGMLVIASILRWPYLAILAVALPGLLAYHTARSIHLSVGNNRWAVKTEAVWTATVVVTAAMVLVLPIDLPVLFAIWAGVPTVALMCSPTVWTLRRDGEGASRGEGFSKRLGMYGGEYLLGAGLAQLSLYILAALAGLDDVGAIRAALIIYAPAQVIIAAIRPEIIPRLARIIGGPRTTEIVEMIRLAVIHWVLLAPFVMAVMLMPYSVGTTLLGGTWDMASPLLVWFGIDVLARPPLLILYAACRVHRLAAALLVTRGVLGPLKVGLVVWAGVSRTPTVGFAKVTAATTLLYVGGWAVSYVLGARASEPSVHDAMRSRVVNRRVSGGRE